MRRECEKNGGHPWEDLANSGYKPDMMHNFLLLSSFCIFGYSLTTKIRIKKNKSQTPLPSHFWQLVT
jgi:hypothetical protein